MRGRFVWSGIRIPSDLHVSNNCTFWTCCEADGKECSVEKMCSNEKVIVAECVIALCERSELKMFADVRWNDGWLGDGHDFVVGCDVSVHVLRRCPSVVSPKMLEVVGETV